MLRSSGQDTRLIVFSGIDGVGKSSLIEELKRRNLLEGAVFLRKEGRRCAQLLSDYHWRAHGDGRDYLDSGFASVRPFATAFDFLTHYEENIRPLFGEVPFIVCDRYVTCAAAYLHAMGHPTAARELFHHVRVPDVTFYVTLDRVLWAERMRLRGGPQEDEGPDLMARYERGFEDILPTYPGGAVRLDNSGLLGSVYAQVELTIRTAVQCPARPFNYGEGFAALRRSSTS